MRQFFKIVNKLFNFLYNGYIVELFFIIELFIYLKKSVPNESMLITTTHL